MGQEYFLGWSQVLSQSLVLRLPGDLLLCVAEEQLTSTLGRVRAPHIWLRGSHVASCAISCLLQPDAVSVGKTARTGGSLHTRVEAGKSMQGAWEWEMLVASALWTVGQALEILKLSLECCSRNARCHESLACLSCCLCWAGFSMPVIPHCWSVHLFWCITWANPHWIQARLWKCLPSACRGSARWTLLARLYCASPWAALGAAACKEQACCRPQLCCPNPQQRDAHTSARNQTHTGTEELTRKLTYPHPCAAPRHSTSRTALCWPSPG